MFSGHSPDDEVLIKFNRSKACQEFITDEFISDEQFLHFLLDMYKQRFFNSLPEKE